MQVKITHTDIVNALKVVATNHVLGVANQIYDENYNAPGDGEYQDAINQKLVQKIKDEATGRANAINDLTNTIDEEYAKKDGTYSALTAGFADELVGNTSDKRKDTKKYIIRSTAGNLDVRSSEPMSLVNIKGVLNDSCEPWVGTSFRFNGFNAIIPSQVITGVAVSSNKVVTGVNKIIYFRSVLGEWGEYGTSLKNNGYLLTYKDGSKYVPVSVTLCDDVPNNGITVAAVPTHTEKEHTYYLPQANAQYLCIEIPASIDPADICAHLAWSNKDDDTYSARTESVINLLPIRNQIHSWGMAGIEQGGKTLYDEINIELVDSGESVVEWYRRLERVQLSSAQLQWEQKTSGGTSTDANVTYIYTASLPESKENGMVKTAFSDLINLVGTTLTFTSQTITTITALREAFGNDYLYYELGTPVTGETKLLATVYGDDMGTEEVIGATDINAYITTAYVVGLKDYLRGLPVELEEYNSVIANHIAKNEADIESLFSFFAGGNMGDVLADSINLNDLKLKVIGLDYWVEGDGTPTETQTFTMYPFREYYDRVAKRFYKGTSADKNAWLEMIDRVALNAAIAPFKAATATTQEINSAIATAINGLDVSDTAVANKYVTSVKEENGKIIVERNYIQVDCGTY